MAAYRPPGRSNRSGRSQADNDVLEGLPVKQWGHSIGRVSMAPPKSEVTVEIDDKWSEPYMPRDFQMLHPWTQHLLRLARSGKVGTKRKADQDSTDDDKQDEEAVDEARKHDLEERGFAAKKWKPVPESLQAPEHKHFEFLAKRRRGLPSIYGPDAPDLTAIPMRKTRVKRANTEGIFFVYDVQVPEGQSIEGELPANMTPEELANLPASANVGPGTYIEGLGTANDDGCFIADHLRPAGSAPRRNRPPPKKKGGPGRGKKRVTFTNPDGSTYTTIVPNATKIVPQPGQTVKHVAKGEEATADVTKEQAAQLHAAKQGSEAGDGDDGDDGEEGDDDDEEDGDDDDDREDGELSDDDNDTPAVATPANATPANATLGAGTPATNGTIDAPPPPPPEEPKDEPTTNGTLEPVDTAMTDAPAVDQREDEEAPSSPETPLVKESHSRKASMNRASDMIPPPASTEEPLPSTTEADTTKEAETTTEAETTIEAETTKEAETTEEADIDSAPSADPASESNLLDNLEKHLEVEKQDDAA